MSCPQMEQLVEPMKQVLFELSLLELKPTLLEQTPVPQLELWLMMQ